MKKDVSIKVRLSEEDKEELIQFAESKGTDLSGATRKLISKFLEHYRIHGKRLIWPPAFDHYPDSVKTKFESKKYNSANGKSEQKAG